LEVSGGSESFAYLPSLADRGGRHTFYCDVLNASFGIERLLHDTSHSVRSTGSLRRALPVLAFVAALLCAWLQPSPAALADIAGGAWKADAPVVDTIGGVDRTAIKPNPPSRLQAATKKRLDTQSGPSPAAIAAAADNVEQANRDTRVDHSRGESIHLPTPAALVAQPRAPPSSRT
jgi:hypothetical protein